MSHTDAGGASVEKLSPTPPGQGPVGSQISEGLFFGAVRSHHRCLYLTH